MAQDDIRQRLIETARSMGISPLDLATAISYETGGTFNPTQPGPHTQWGQHRGLIQFGEPQAKKYGVDWNDPLNSQLGANGAVANYLRDTGVKPGMGLLDIYSAINAGGVGKYDASDANNGGAPGTVRDKVENQMSGHRLKAANMLGMAAPQNLSGIGSPNVFGSMSPGGGMTAQDNSIPMDVANHVSTMSDGTEKLNPLEKAGAYFSKAAKAHQAPGINGAFSGDARQAAGGLAKLLQNPQALAQMLMQRRMS